MLACCGNSEHQWEKHRVGQRWFPQPLKCLIIGENPGDVKSQYFYDEPSSYNSDDVVVRRSLLQGLYECGIIQQATLQSFRDAGFLFDHAIRCQLAPSAVNLERRRAMTYKSSRVDGSFHLESSVKQATVIWVMGHLASNAVANVTLEFPKSKRRISKNPFPCGISTSTRFFVSEYITWRNQKRANEFCEAFRIFSDGKVSFTNS